MAKHIYLGAGLEKIAPQDVIKFHKEFNKTIDKEKTLDENINRFALLSKSDVDNINRIDRDLNNRETYSNKRYSLCTQEEQTRFMNARFDINLLVCDSIRAKYGDVTSFPYMWRCYLHNAEYGKLPKLLHKPFYSKSCDSERPVGDAAWDSWNGFQTFDLDIKDAYLARRVKPILFDYLSRSFWFLGLSLSTSGNGIHIWTKVIPVSEAKNRRVEFVMNYRQKFSAVYTALEYASYVLSQDEEVKELISNNKLDSDKIQFEYMRRWIDMSMCKPQQATFIPYDPEAELSTNFVHTSIDYNFDLAYEYGENACDWIDRKDLQEIFAKYQYFSDNTIKSNEVNKTEAFDSTSGSKSHISTARHYKHFQRWQLANTLCAVYGQDKGYNLLRQICSPKTSDYELMSDMKTAAAYNKPISRWAVSELNRQHGFHIQIKENSAEEIEIRDEKDIKFDDDKNSPVYILNRDAKAVELHLNSNQYLSDIQSEILSNLGRISLLEAGAGYGKTEMIKRLPGRKLLVVPFTSIIKSKIEADSMGDDWLTYYSSKTPSRKDMMSDKSMVMTVDKFSKMNIFDITNSGFDYIVIDESHLLFVSAYRDVMAGAIQRAINVINNVKVILMTGTPTGELLFIPQLKYIRVKKDETRQKQFKLIMNHSQNELIYNMCEDMASAIQKGKHIIFPTNSGNKYVTQIFGLVQEILNERHFGRTLNTFYYKKSNSGTADMNKIDQDKSIGENDIIACTNYLSVGVDICDKYQFEVFFDEIIMPQDVEQFTNRIRNNDLFIRLYLSKLDHVGLPFDYNKVKPLNLSFDKTELVRTYDALQTCNDALNRNGNELKYNDFVSKIRSENTYIKFDEVKRSYYIDQTTYKLHLFEERYKEFITQLPEVIKSMQYYGYEVVKEDKSLVMSDAQIDALKELLKRCKDSETNRQTAVTFEFLNSLTDNNIDVYNDIAKGNYDIIRSDVYEQDRINNNIKVTDVEIITRNMPYINTFYKWYDIDTIKEIYEHCTELKSNRISKSKLERIRKFTIFESRRLNKKLDIPVYNFYKESYDFALANPEVKVSDVEFFVANWCCKYCNNVNDIVIEKEKDENGKETGSQKYLQGMQKIFKDVFWVLIEKGKRSLKNGTVKIKPFELLWKRKEYVNNICEDKNLQMILLDDLTSKIRNVEFENEKDDTDMSNLSIETRKQLANYNIQLKENKGIIKHSSPEDIPVEYRLSTSNNYNNYSKEDSSNDRFLYMQKNQYNVIQNSINNIYNSEEEKQDTAINIVSIKHQPTLFDNIQSNENVTQKEVNDEQNNKNNVNKEKSVAEMLNIKDDEEYQTDYVNADMLDKIFGEDGLACPF